jgi:hypothetical protein
MELPFSPYATLSDVAILLNPTDPSENDLSERSQKVFDFASDVTKQLITLSTGVVALTITFSKDILGGVAEDKVNVFFFFWKVKETQLLASAWLVYLISIVFGIVALMALTGSLERPRGSTDSVYTPNIVIPSVAQILLFLAATFAVIRFGMASV